MKLVLYALIILLDMVAISIQKDINAILDQLIDQSEGGVDEAKGMQIHVQEKTGNDSRIIYIKTYLRLDVPNITITNITGTFNHENRSHVGVETKYDTISEELQVEIETQPDNEINKDLKNVQDYMSTEVLRSAFPDDYVENDIHPNLDSDIPEINGHSDLLSRYPEIMFDPLVNKFGRNNDFVREMAKDLLENKEEFKEEPTETPITSIEEEKPFQPKAAPEDELSVLEDLLMNLKTIPKNNYGNDKSLYGNNYPAVDSMQYPKEAFLDNFSKLTLNPSLQNNMFYPNQPPVLDILSASFPVPNLVPLQKVRTVIHHSGPMFSPEPQWPGTCCTQI